MGKPRVRAITGFTVAAMALAAGFVASSCGQTPTNVPIRTFEGAQRVAVVCLEVNDPTTGIATPVATPVAQSLCAPVAPGVIGSSLPYHLIATVTQTRRGELAVVDLTAGYVVDEDRATPGINFIPVGTNPTDVVVAPGSHPDMTFVASASATKPAIFAIPSERLLGDSTNVKSPPLLLTDLPVCALSQPPIALGVVPLQGASTADGGANAEGGASAPTDYRLVALLGAQGNQSARVVTIDQASLTVPKGTAAPSPCAILGGVSLSETLPPTWFPGPAWPDGVAYVDGGAGDLTAHLPAIDPYGLACPGTAIATPAPDAGATSNDAGTMGIDAGAVAEAGAEDAGADDAGPADASPADASADDASLADADDAGAVVSDAGVTMPALTPDAGFTFPASPLASPAPPAMIVMRDDAPILYVADSSLPMIHVIDLSHPNAPVLLAPLLATSVTQPSRQVQIGPIALSPATRDYKRYLYAVDFAAGSLMVFDVTDASAQSTSPHVPLLRPHPELDPFVPVDRLTFGAPVAAVAFAQHDWPLLNPNPAAPHGSQLAYQGLLCNPNPNAHTTNSAGQQTFADLGSYYRADQTSNIQPNATTQNLPSRLRGIFGFATLTNGTVVTIDVDDWDAPCRRPDPMAAGTLTNSLDIPQTPPTSASDLDPYHAPQTYQSVLGETAAVTLEQFFPVSAPHRSRSNVLLRNDPTSGNHLPNVVQAPQLADVNGTPVATSSKAGIAVSLILPTALDPGFIDPTLVENPSEANPALRTPVPGLGDAGLPVNAQGAPIPGVRLSFEDPTVQLTQDWTVAYEGVLPSSPGIVASIQSTVQPDSSANAYTTLTLSTQGADLCGLGIEDWSLGQARANTVLAAIDPALVTDKGVKTLPQWTSDYVEITDDILPQGDPYWSLPGSACWSDVPVTIAGRSVADGTPGVADNRYNLCEGNFGAPGTNPDLEINRDAPILEAYKDQLKVGRFGHTTSPIERTQNRTIDPGSSHNPPFLKLITCCFHKQAAFKVRAGGEWVAVGQQGLGLLHHVVAAPSTDPTDPNKNRCELSCDPRDRLLNARSFDIPWTAKADCSGARPTIDRNSVLAMRNPMFSYVTFAACGGMPMDGDHTLSARDLTWRFSVTGGFSPLTVSLGGTTGASVSPQSMLFINSLGQLAVVDGAEQGLVLIDLNTVGFSTNYF